MQTMLCKAESPFPPKGKKKLRVLGAHFTDEEAEAQGAKEPKKGVLTPRNSGGEKEHILREITGWWRKICHKEAAPGLMREIEFYPGYAASRMTSTQPNPVGVSQSCGETSPCFGSPSMFVRAQTVLWELPSGSETQGEEKGTTSS